MFIFAWLVLVKMSFVTQSANLGCGCGKNLDKLPMTQLELISSTPFCILPLISSTSYNNLHDRVNRESKVLQKV